VSLSKPRTIASALGIQLLGIDNKKKKKRENMK